MISVLAGYTSPQAQLQVRQPVVGLFADQELRMVDGPLFVGENYLIRREVVALSESKRTESYWVRTRIFDDAGQWIKAEMLLNHATRKNFLPTTTYYVMQARRFGLYLRLPGVAPASVPARINPKGTGAAADSPSPGRPHQMRRTRFQP